MNSFNGRLNSFLRSFNVFVFLKVFEGLEKYQILTLAMKILCVLALIDFDLYNGFSQLGIFIQNLNNRMWHVR